MKRTAFQASGGEDLNQPSEAELIDLDFEFFNFEPIDYKSVSNLLRQLLTHDADLFHIGALADFLVQDDNVLGSTVKCDDEGDPYAFCTLIDLASHATHTAISPLLAYLLSKSANKPGAETIHSILQQCSTPNLPLNQHPGLILNERLLNMPPQITAPFLRLIMEEMDMAEEKNLPFKVGHLLYFSRIFVPPIPESEGEAMQQETNKRRKPSSGMPAATQESYYPYHVEDEVIAEYATSICDFDFTNEPEPTNKPRRDDAFGVAEQGRLMLIPVDKLSALVERLDKEGV